MPAQRRERRKTTVLAAAQGSDLAEDHPGAMCLGRQPQEGQLSASAIPATAAPAWTQKGDLCRRRLDPDRRLPHAPGRHFLSRPRRRALPPHLARDPGQPPRPPNRQARLLLRAHPRSGRFGFCLAGCWNQLWPGDRSEIAPARRRPAGKRMDTQAGIATSPPVAAEAPRRWSGPAASTVWTGLLLVVLAFLVIYPVCMLLIGALTGGDPVVDGYRLSTASVDNFVSVLANPNVHTALLNSLIACTGGTALAVLIGLAFAWIVVRTDT